MKREFIDVVYKLALKGNEMGFYHLTSDQQPFDGRNIWLKGKELRFFSNCSYLGLETNETMKHAAIEAVQKYGTQFSSSRATISMGMYEELEDLLGQIFKRPTYLTPTTSLGHIALIPTIINERDAIILDHQVHTSVKNAVQIVKGDGIHVELMRHNRMDHLETRIQILKQKYDRVWYMADGIYSMYGDGAPVKELYELLNRYEQFHLYVDDAHGMSWMGRNGNGYLLSQAPFHPRLVLTSSLAKGFASCGGALVFYDEYQKDIIKNCSTISIFSGPLQPAVLGASIASAKIHLSGELEKLQDALFERILYFIQSAKRYNVPIVSDALTPIFFIAIGNQDVSRKLSRYLLDEGFYCMNTVFPAVPVKNSGLRITVTNHNTIEDIDGILKRISYALPKFMAEENYSYEQLYKAFKMVDPNEQREEEYVRKIA